MDSITMKKRFDRMPNLPTLPQVALKVNELLQDSNISVRILSDIIMKDQAIVTNILKLVNSSFYGFPSKFDSISRAILVLGFETLRNAILSVSVTQTLSKANSQVGFSITDFWRHSIAVAVTCRQLSIRIPLEVPETCFVGGLIHDMGKVIIASFFIEEFQQVLTLCRSGHHYLDAERSVLPLDHARIGGYLAERWRLPENLINAVSYHHKPREDVVGSNLAILVHAADIIVNRIMNGDDTSPLNVASTEKTKIIMDLFETSSNWFGEIQAEIENACDFFKIN
jgi:putative nucleotidyltransferase with HDIG domain